MRGENYIYAFPEVIKNKKIVNKNEVISSIELSLERPNLDEVSKNIKILLSSTLAEVKRRGSLSSELQINTNEINSIANNLRKKNNVLIILNAISSQTSETADPVSVRLEIGTIKSLKNL